MISANPTGFLHLGHGRNAFISDSVAKILKFDGSSVKTEYYINDAGNQIMGDNYNFHIYPIFKKIKLLNFNDVYTLSSKTFIFKGCF